MIFNTGSQLSPKVRVELGNVEVDYTTIVGFELDLSINKHDTLVISMLGIPPKAITDYVGAPVRCAISNGPGRAQEFVGYVLYVHPEYNISAPVVNSSVFYSAKIVCMGASVEMKSTKSRVWGEAPIHVIAQDIVKQYNFSASILRDDFVIRNAVQAKESDWEFLVRLCNDYGYSITVHGTHLSVWDPFQAIGRRPSFAALIPQTSLSGPVPGGIVAFSGTFGYLTTEGESYKYRISTIDDNGTVYDLSDPENGPVKSWSGKGETPTYTSSLVGTATSIVEGQKMLDAQRKKNFAFNADVTVIAGTGIVPGGVVSVEGYNSNFEGLWYVQHVQHVLNKADYITKLKISRDFNTSGEYLIPPVSVSEGLYESTFTDNRWVADKQTVELYV